MAPALAFACALELAFAQVGADPVASTKELRFEPALRVAAGGTPIDHGAQGGHCGPTLHDVDGDGVKDLVVGDASGRFTVYRNVGSAHQPEFVAGVRLNAGGAEARVPAGGALGPLGSSPRFVDFDGDGITDLVSGCHDPGTYWLFPARDLGEFERGREIADGDGKPLRRVCDPEAGESFGSWVDAVDWDADGDLDLVGGALDGALFVFVNEGSRTTPRYLPIPARVRQSDGALARVPGGHAAVVAADWDGDGAFDLVCGSASGAVVWFRNVAGLGELRFTPPETLIAPARGDGRSVWLEPGGEIPPGVDAQIDVVDWNGDGLQDLLVGDFCTTISPRDDLTDEQKRAVASLRLQRESSDAAAVALRPNLDEDLSKFLRKVAGRPASDDWQQPHGSICVHVRK